MNFYVIMITIVCIGNGVLLVSTGNETNHLAGAVILLGACFCAGLGSIAEKIGNTKS